MALDRYRIYLDDLDLSEDEKLNLIEVAEAIVSNLINILFTEQSINDRNQ